MVELEFVVPAPDLAAYLTLFYHFRTSLTRFEDVERAGHAQLRFRLAGENARYRFADGSEQQVGRVHLIGPTIGPRRTEADGPIEVIGMGLTPVGWATLVRSDASAMLNRAVDADQLFAGIDGLADALTTATTTTAKVAVAETFLRKLLKGAATDVVRFAQQVDGWLAGAPSPELEVLEATTGLSRRQVERRCNALYGAPPKVLARKYRALRTAVALVQDGESITDALNRGFYDQSHLIREVKQFTGCTPRQLRANPALLAHMTIARRSALEGQVSPLVSET